MNGLRVRDSSAWDEAGIRAFFSEQRIPLRLACRGRDGRPLVCSLWYLFEGGQLWCATHRDSAIIGLLREDAGCGFEVATNDPPYRGVRGQCDVSLVPDRGAKILARLIDRYLGSDESPLARWLLSRADAEIALALDPDWITAWDFTERMQQPGSR